MSYLIIRSRSTGLWRNTCPAFHSNAIALLNKLRCKIA